MRYGFVGTLGVLLRPLQLLLYWLSGLTRRDMRRWVFGAWHGKRLTDNAAALFLYCVEHPDKGMEPIWIASSREVLRQARERGLCAYHAWSPRGLHACLTAGVFVFVSTTRDINHWASRGAKTVLLRHGVGVKKIGRAHANPSHLLYRFYHGNPLQRAFWRIVLHWHTVSFDLVIATSPLHAEQAVEYFGVSPDRVVITGFPRNDVALSSATDTWDVDLNRWLADIAEQRQSLFFYMPTFRDDGTRPYDFSWPELDRRLEKLGAKLLVRVHFADRSGFAAAMNGSLRNIRLHDPNGDPYRVFHAVRALITDFSSVAYDFMLLGRPVIFFTPDEERFKRMRSLYFDYDEVTPGPRARTIDELERAMASVIEGSDGSREASQRLVERLHTYRDAQSSSRVFNAIVERLVNA